MNKLLSRIPRNLNNDTTLSFHSIFSNTSRYLCRAEPVHIHSSHFNCPHRFYSHYSSCSTHSWRSLKNFSKKFSGVFSNPVLRKQFSSNFLWRGTSGGLVDGRVGFLRAQFQKRSFHYNSAFQHHRRTWKASLRRLTTDGVVVGLIVTNVAVFLLWHILDRQFMMKNFMISVDNFRSGRLHTLITSAFSHIDSWHLISNMIGLYFFGMNIGRMFGPQFLLKLYLSGAVVGSLFYLAYHSFMAQLSQSKRMWGTDYSRIPGLGASGAVNAVMLLDIFLFPKNTLYLEFIIPIPAILLGIFLIGKDVLRILEGDAQISGSAHLGGAVVAAIAWARIRRGRF